MFIACSLFHKALYLFLVAELYIRKHQFTMKPCLRLKELEKAISAHLHIEYKLRPLFNVTCPTRGPLGAVFK